VLFYQPADGYCFNSDSIFLYDFAARFRPKGDLLDVGAGVGILGLLFARDFNVRVTLVEKQSKMAELARINARINGLEASIVEDDFLRHAFEKQFDTIVSNPPFYPEEVVQSPDDHIHACRYNLHLPIDDFFQKVKKIIKPRGRFIFCYDPTQITALLSALERVGLKAEEIRFVHPKIDRPAKLVLIAARNQSRARQRVLAPLIVHDEKGYTPEAAKAFQKARTHTIKCLT